MKKQDVIYPDRTCLGGGKDRVKGASYNYTFLASDLFIWICHFTVSWETALRPTVYSDEIRCDWKKAKEFPFWWASLLNPATALEICASKPLVTYKTCKLRGKRHSHTPHPKQTNKKTCWRSHTWLKPGELFNAVLPQWLILFSDL